MHGKGMKRRRERNTRANVVATRGGERESVIGWGTIAPSLVANNPSLLFAIFSPSRRLGQGPRSGRLPLRPVTDTKIVFAFTGRGHLTFLD